MDDSKPATGHDDWLSADRPIRSRAEDTLGRSGFSESLANAVSRWTGRESLVVALYGPWGNGKSSIKNMVVERLDGASPKVRTVEFNPWQLANRPSLSEAFFDELGIALGKGDLGSNRAKKAILGQYRRWARRLQGGRDLVSATRHLVVVLLACIGAGILGASWAHSQVAVLIVGVSAIAAAILAALTKVVQATVTFLEAGTEIGERSLAEVKEELAKALRKLKSPILVIIDDLDRLTPEELLEVFQLIKANADFPNLVYLLVADRAIVEKTVASRLNVPGRDYLEKIVQVAFDVPMIDISRVHRVLFTRLNSLLALEGVSTHFEEKRWGNVFLSGLHGYFRTLRDVNRFISTLSFQISYLSTSGAFEVNPIDLIGLETIRLFEPEVYAALASSKILLTSSKPEGAAQKSAQDALHSIIELGSKEHRSNLEKIIIHLFPTASWAFDRGNYSADYQPKWYRELRVCSAKMFDRYFRLSVSEEELSQADVHRVLRSRGDREKLRSELLSLSSRGLLQPAFDELGIHEDEVEPAQVEPYITAIFDAGDQLSDDLRGMFEVPVSWRVSFLVQHALRKITDRKSRLEAMSQALRATAGLDMALQVTALILGKEKEGEESLFSESESDDLRTIALRKIEDAAQSGALARSSKMALLVNLWREWGDPADAAGYVDRTTNSSEGVLQFLKSLELRSLGHEMGDYIGTERYYMRRDEIERFIPIDNLKIKLENLRDEDLDDEGRRAVASFRKALARRDKGLPDDGPFARD